MWWVWQFEGQWRTESDHESAEAGNVPSWASVAEPLKAIRSPTAHVRLECGAVIVGTGGVFPAEIATVSVADAPWGSVTFRPTL